MSKAKTPKDTKNPLSLWSLTLSASKNDTDWQDIKQVCKELGKRWCFQKERGEEKTEANPDGYLHWQLQFSLFKEARKKQVCQLLRTSSGWVFHDDAVRPMSNKGKDTVYSMKLQTRVEGPWCDKDAPPKYVQRRFREAKLKGWQQHIRDRIKKQLTDQDDRHVIMVHEPSGCVGKSFLKGYMKSHDQNVLIVPSSMDSAEKIMQYVCDLTQEGEQYILLMDMPRATNAKHWWTICNGLEILKQGFLHDGRNHAVEKTIEPPGMCVFANAKPPDGPMSSDVFEYIDLEELIKKYKILNK